MRYIPNDTPTDRAFLCEALGIASLDDLFAVIPEALRLQAPLAVPEALDETRLLQHLRGLASRNATVTEFASFLGAGAYHHYRPVVIDHLLQRSEFATAYTPYQPEMSQGTLQAMFEFQSLVCALTGMEVANASLYDGASALAEALLMATRITKRGRCLVARAVHPEYRQVARTYIAAPERRIEEVPFTACGLTDLAALDEALDDRTAAVALQYPNYFGGVEEIEEAATLAHARGALLIAVVTEPIALGILASPGALDADIVCGEGQSLGIPLAYGGPYLGLFATRERFVRHVPGRIVGETVDARGTRGYVLTLTTREQHIRRETATSNICTNQGLMALAATIYMTLMGRRGLREVALLNLDAAEYAKALLTKTPGVRLPFDAPTFNEFVVQTEREAGAVLARLASRRILGGVLLGPDYPEIPNGILLCATETASRESIEALAAVLEATAAVA